MAFSSALFTGLLEGFYHKYQLLCAHVHNVTFVLDEVVVQLSCKLYPVILALFFNHLDGLLLSLCIIHNTVNYGSSDIQSYIYSPVNIGCCIMYTVYCPERVGVVSRGVLHYLRLQWLCKPNSTQQWGNGMGGSVILGQNGLMAAVFEGRAAAFTPPPFLSLSKSLLLTLFIT